jgi:hypothetical protein
MTDLISLMSRLVDSAGNILVPGVDDMVQAAGVEERWVFAVFFLRVYFRLLCVFLSSLLYFFWRFSFWVWTWIWRARVVVWWMQMRFPIGALLRGMMRVGLSISSRAMGYTRRMCISISGAFFMSLRLSLHSTLYLYAPSLILRTNIKLFSTQRDLRQARLQHRGRGERGGGEDRVECG